MTGTNSVLIRYNLQFFADDSGDKTEEPTAKKIEDSRKEGSVAKSKEVSNAVTLLAFFLSLDIFIPFVSKRMVDMFEIFWRDMDTLSRGDLSSVAMWQVMFDTVIYIVITVLPFLLIALVVGFFSERLQIKWMITTKPLQPKLSKLNPISGFKRMFSKESLFNLLMSILKIVVFGAVSVSVVKDNLGAFITVYELEIYDSLGIMFDIIMDLGIKISMVYLVFGAADLFFQKWKHKKELRMSKTEVKDEFKNQEGDPKVKGQQKQRMQQAARRRMMNSIPEADVVITNPTHFAVALKYDNTMNMAPVVVAKGADYLAMKIKDIARENDVSIVENKPLARMLYANVEVGNEIPAELYQAVAEILAQIYKEKNKV